MFTTLPKPHNNGVSLIHRDQRHTASRGVALCCVALRCVVLRCVALRCVALRCVALLCARQQSVFSSTSPAELWGVGVAPPDLHPYLYLTRGSLNHLHSSPPLGCLTAVWTEEHVRCFHLTRTDRHTHTSTPIWQMANLRFSLKIFTDTDTIVTKIHKLLGKNPALVQWTKRQRHPFIPWCLWEIVIHPYKEDSPSQGLFMTFLGSRVRAQT